MEPMNAPGNQSGAMQTIYCSYCSVQLSFPRGSMYIQCPRCQATQNPHAPQQTVCIGCGTLLAHPANSLFIQCPKCLITQNARENRTNIAANTPNAQFAPEAQQLTKTPKKKKDPNAPKAASNAYMIFCKERRAQLKSENPALAFGKIGAKLGELWRTLSADEKRPYEERASTDRERYRKDMESYKADGDHHGGVDDHGSASKKRYHSQFEEPESNFSDDVVGGMDKRAKVESQPEYHEMGMYSHGFGDHAHHHDDSADNLGFSDRVAKEEIGSMSAAQQQPVMHQTLHSQHPQQLSIGHAGIASSDQLREMSGQTLSRDGHVLQHNQLQHDMHAHHQQYNLHGLRQHQDVHDRQHAADDLNSSGDALLDLNVHHQQDDTGLHRHLHQFAQEPLDEEPLSREYAQDLHRFSQDTLGHKPFTAAVSDTEDFDPSRSDSDIEN